MTVYIVMDESETYEHMDGYDPADGECNITERYVYGVYSNWDKAVKVCLELHKPFYVSDKETIPQEWISEFEVED